MFDLAKDGKKLKALETDVDAWALLWTTAQILRPDLIADLRRDAQGAAITAIAKKMELSPVANTLALMAHKRRLFVSAPVGRTLREMIAEDKGEVTADVTAPRH